MKTTALRIYGKRDIRLESFELPMPGEDEILAKIISDSLCMSSYKAAMQGSDHKRIPNDVAQNPIILGHEFCGELVTVGSKWKGRFTEGQRFAIQPAINEPGNVHAAPGYSFRHIGGDATYVIIPNVVMERGCLLPFDGDNFFMGSLAEPVSCVVGGFNVNYHTRPGSYIHEMGIVKGGCMALLAGVGPMGLGAIDFALHCDRRPSLLVVTDIDSARLSRAEELYPVEEAERCGVKLIYVNTRELADVPGHLRSLTPDARGYDDVFVYAPVASVVEQADVILAFDGCLNFFAGPTNPEFSAKFNFYNVHYMATHVAGNSGGNTDDLKQSLSMMAAGKINPASMITHVGGLDAAAGATLSLPDIPGGKKLIYTHISMPLTALTELRGAGYGELADMVAAHGGLWSGEAEKWLLENGNPLEV